MKRFIAALAGVSALCLAGASRAEISGGVTLSRMNELAATGADYVSIGALTHSAPAADLSFEIEPI